MMWFLLACAAPVFWATTNYIDKIILSRLSAHTAVSTLMLFSSLIAVISAPVVFVFNAQRSVEWSMNSALLCLVGLLYALGIWCYFLAMNIDDASTVVPFFQLMPVLVALLAFFFLGETLSVMQLWAAGAVTFGALLLTIDLTHGIRWRGRVAFYMLTSSLSLAVASVLFKFVTIEDSFWTAWMWEQVGLALFGVLLFLVPRYRRDFVQTVRTASKRFFGANILNEVITLIGNALSRFASLLAPVALVNVVSNAIQPVIVLCFGVILTLVYPQILKENIGRKHILQKVFAISSMGIGTYFLSPFV